MRRVVVACGRRGAGSVPGWWSAGAALRPACRPSPTPTASPRPGSRSPGQSRRPAPARTPHPGRPARPACASAWPAEAAPWPAHRHRGRSATETDTGPRRHRHPARCHYFPAAAAVTAADQWPPRPNPSRPDTTPDHYPKSTVDLGDIGPTDPLIPPTLTASQTYSDHADIGVSCERRGSPYHRRPMAEVGDVVPTWPVGGWWFPTRCGAGHVLGPRRCWQAIIPVTVEVTSVGRAPPCGDTTYAPPLGENCRPCPGRPTRASTRPATIGQMVLTSLGPGDGRQGRDHAGAARRIDHIGHVAAAPGHQHLHATALHELRVIGLQLGVVLDAESPGAALRPSEPPSYSEASAAQSASVGH